MLKKSAKRSLSLVLMLLWMSLPLLAQKPEPATGKVLQSPSQWEGVFFRVVHCERLPGNRVLLGFHAVRPPGGGGAILLHGDGPDRIFYETDTQGKKFVSSRSKAMYSLASIQISDAVSGIALKPAPARPSDPTAGPVETEYALRADEAIPLGIIVTLPEATPNQPVILTLRLPGTRREIKGLPVAEKEGVNTIGSGFRVAAPNRD